MLWNPYRNPNLLARQGALGLLLAMVLGVLILLLVRAPEAGWPSARQIPALPLPLPGSGPESRISQPHAPAQLPAPEVRSEPILGSAATVAADQTVTGQPAAALTSEAPGASAQAAAGPSATLAAVPPAPAVVVQATVPEPPAPPVGQATVSGPPPLPPVSVQAPPVPPVTVQAPPIPPVTVKAPPPPPAGAPPLPLQPPALPPVPQVPPTPHL